LAEEEEEPTHTSTNKHYWKHRSTAFATWVVNKGYSVASPNEFTNPDTILTHYVTEICSPGSSWI